MQCQQVHLLRRLDRHEAHGRALHCFGYCLGGLEGPFWHPVSWLRRADRSSISSFHLADSAGKLSGCNFARRFVSSAGSSCETIPSEPPSLAHPNWWATVAGRDGGPPFCEPERAVVQDGGAP